jgi:hypothetical protein
LEVLAEPGDELSRELGVSDLVYGSGHLPGVPGRADIPIRISGAEPAQQLGLPTIVETLMRLCQQALGPIERLVLAASVADYFQGGNRLVIRPAL